MGTIDYPWICETHKYVGLEQTSNLKAPYSTLLSSPDAADIMQELVIFVEGSTEKDLPAILFKLNK